MLELEEKGFKNAKEIIENIKKSIPDLKLEKTLNTLKSLIGKNHIVFDPFLARGHDYYTGTIFEITIPGLGYGSFAGGGRYDNLLENIGGEKIPACGISLGVDRFIDILKEIKKEMFSKTVIDISIIGFEEQDILEVFQFANKLIDKNINCEIYSNYDKKLEKQLKFVDQKNIQFVLIFQKEKILKDLKNRKEYIVKTPEDIFDIIFK
jgi:histidyl-tRNA synthetase